MKKAYGSIVILVAVFVSGCVSTNSNFPTKQTQSSPEIIWAYEHIQSSSETKDYLVTITPSGLHAYNGFNLSVKNKSTKNIEINWNKTLYVVDGVTSGGFMFSGVVYKDRNNPKLSDVVFPGMDFKRTIYPNSLVNFSLGDWRHPLMKEGVHGIYIVFNIEGREYSEKLTIRFFKMAK
jgi:hypothetical protein